MDTHAATDAGAADESPSGDDSLLKAIQQLQAQLAVQSKQIEQLQKKYTSEVEARQKEIDKQDKQISAQAQQIDTQREAIQALQQQADQAKSLAGADVSESEKVLRSRLETLEQSIKSSQESESTSYDIKSFPGSLPIPGTSAAIKIGGFVKMNVVESFDPVGTDDRFIVGSIPVPQQSATNVAALTVAPSRLNIEMRDKTKYGPVRAFLEADFAGSGDTFRLRHAFGQYKSFLIGKTWSTFMDARSTPEDLDFEGINGQILIRQPQVRYFPRIGQDWHLLLSAEDPKATIQGGQGISQFPDLVASVQYTWLERWHLKTSILLRKMYGECNCLDGKSDTARGWAYSVSGTTGISRWDERDNLQIQLSYGEGYSHYVNDLNTVAEADAVFDPETGRLFPVPVFAMYIEFQKWWTQSMRSNLNYGYVNVDNDHNPDPTAYASTNRFAVNFIWSPIARIDLGAEFLAGSRTNEDGEKGKAKQVQLSAKYRY
ncbi:MAG: DcaP family trimeric outer membrane transporter [Lysobacterales bacterium]